MSAERIAILEDLGFAWDALEAAWENGFRHLTAFRDAHGHCNVPADQNTGPPDAFALGHWVANLRQSYKRGDVLPERISRLAGAGFAWTPLDTAWENGFRHLTAFRDAHGHCRVTSRHWPDDGFALLSWVRKQRNAYSTRRRHAEDGGGGYSTDRSREHIERLESIGFVWNARQSSWRASFRHLIAFGYEHGHFNVPTRYRTEDGFPLGTWVGTQRRFYKDGKVSAERIFKLECIGFAWGER
jgi:hypothetical protein